MAEYRISGVWKSNNDAVTHYAFHEVLSRTILKAERKTKAEAIALLQQKENSANIWIWDYEKSTWSVGDEVEVATGWTGKYLRCKRDSKATDNLGHLINYEWI